MELGFIYSKTDIGIQKIDGSALKTYKIVMLDFLIQNRLEKFNSLRRLSC